MSTFVAAFLASFCFVGLKSFQQLNVVHDQYLLVVPTSVLMAMCEVYVVANIAAMGWHIPLVLSVGFGSGLGCLVSMISHKAFRHATDRS